MVRSSRVLRASALVAIASATLPCQHEQAIATTTPPAAQGATPAGGAGSRLVLEVYSEGMSRASFAACDANADDRLSFIESSRAIENAGDTQAVAAFRRMDLDSDGYLSWFEFDRAFQSVIQQGGTLRLRLQRPLINIAPVAPAPDRVEAERLISTLDTDGDEQLGLAEFTVLLARKRQTEDPQTIFARLDTDGSAALSVKELAELTRIVPGLAVTRESDLRAHGTLPERHRPADLNLDGALNVFELERVLRRVDPELHHWAKKILTDADRSHNGSLGAAELQAARGEQVK